MEYVFIGGVAIGGLGVGLCVILIDIFSKYLKKIKRFNEKLDKFIESEENKNA